jgi:hypothetical protein
VGETWLVQLGTFILSLIGLFILLKVLKKTPKDYFIVSMIVLFIFLTIGRLIFLVIYFVDICDGSLFNPVFYNWFSSFLSFFTSFCVLYVGTLALGRMKKNE